MTAEQPPYLSGEGPRVDVIGIGADGAARLRPDLLERIYAADFLAGGERHLAYFPEARGERFILRDNLFDLLGELGRRFPAQRCVVLASGDPLFYGVGTYLAGIMGRENVRIEPALSSMQLAFARAGLPWQYASLASVHGRNLRTTLLPLLGQCYVGLFTQDGDSPAAVARFYLAHDLDEYEAIVGENLGADGERVTRWPDLQTLAAQRFAPLNYLILHRRRYPLPGPEVEQRRSLVPGAPDTEFARPAEGPEVMTRQEVRSVVLGKLGGKLDPGDTVWDVGAGLGTVAVELAVLRPHVEVIAMERDPARAALARENRLRFGAYNMTVLEGTAPEVLVQGLLAGASGLCQRERPRQVFVGGSGEHLPAILDLVAERLLGGGRLAANFVTLEHLALTLERLRKWGWPFEVTEVHVARSDSLAGLTGLRPQRGVFLVCADRPADSPATAPATSALAEVKHA
jgi:precorrin-6Y C5,15-methyltransferase (decarboxylating)